MCHQIIDIHNIIMMQVETRDAHLPHTLWRNDYHLQDVKMIFCLSLCGHPVTGVVDESTCIDLVEQFYGRRPSDAEVKGTK